MVSGDHFPSFLISNLWLPTNISNKVTWSHSRNSNLWCLESLPVCALEVPTFFSRINQMGDVSICRKWRNSTNLRISRWGDEREAVWRASSDASAGGLACPVGSASLFVDRPAGCIVCIALPGSPGARRFVSFAPEGPRSWSLDHTRVCLPTKVRSCLFMFLSLHRDSLIPRMFFHRLLLVIRTMTWTNKRDYTW